MMSYQFREYGEPLELVGKAQPEPTGTEVLVRVQACGVCHSDLHMWEGHFDLGNDRKLDVRGGRELPFTLGHEIVGEGVATGLLPGQQWACRHATWRLRSLSIRIVDPRGMTTELW